MIPFGSRGERMLNEARLCEVIKSELRKKRLTISAFAEDLEVPLPTLKRWLKGKGVSLSAWTKMLNVLGLSLSEVAITVSDPVTTQFTYTLRQEKELATVPGLIAFFQELLSGKDVALIAQQHKLNSRSIAFYLRKLDAIGIITWGDGQNVKLKTRGEPKWRKNGELSKAFRSKVFHEFIEVNKEELRIGLYNISDKDELKLRQMADELFLFAQQAERQCMLRKASVKPFGMAWLMEKYEADFIVSIPNRS